MKRNKVILELRRNQIFKMRKNIKEETYGELKVLLEEIQQEVDSYEDQG